MLAAALSLGLAFSGTAMAQVKPPPCDPNKEVCEPPPKGEPCSPGFWKRHQSLWNFIGSPFCGGADQPTCEDLLTALECRGSDSSCGRSAAAGYLNSLTDCTE